MTVIIILLVLLFGLAAIVWGISSTSQAWASAQAAKAAIESGRAAHAASVGNTVAIAAILALVVLLLAVTAYAIYLRLRLERAMPQHGHSGRWVSGPNARWKKVGAQQNALPDLDTLVQLQMVEILRAMQQQNAPTLSSPDAVDESQDDWLGMTEWPS